MGRVPRTVVFLAAALGSACSGDACTETQVCAPVAGGDGASGGGGSTATGGNGMGGSTGGNGMGGSTGGNGMGSGGANAALPSCARGIAAAQTHSCAARGDGSIWCWGSGTRGQLGQGSKSSSPIPVRVAALSGAIAWDSYSDHNCAIVGEGDLYCWGENASFQLGDPTLAESSTPIQRTGIRNAVAVSVGMQEGCKSDQRGVCGYSCAVTSDGLVRCWGAGEFGTLGTGNDAATHLPVEVVGVGAASAVFARSSHACAQLSEDGHLRCWGQNGAAQLGNGTTIDSNISVEVTNVPAVGDVAIGGQHTCVLLANDPVGVPLCWGANDVGQLGRGVTETFSATAQNVADVSGIIQVAAGQSHTCALEKSGRVWCWGDNSFGQLGDGSFGDNMESAFPIEVANVAGAERIAVGKNHACALLTDDSVWCWGSNNQGQLGDGTTQDRPLPVEVKALYEQGDE